MGKLRFGTKSDIASCLEKLVSTSKDVRTYVQSRPSLADDTPIVHAAILDGAAILNIC